MSRVALITPAALALVLAACTATPSPTAIPTARPSPTLPPTSAPATPTPSPVATPSPRPSESLPLESPQTSHFPVGSVIVTFRVEAEEFRVLLVEPADVANAQALLAGEEAPSIPNGLIVRDEPSVNEPWTWHLDPDSIEFAEVTIELCDGLPSFVEDRTLTGDRFCPWGAVVIAVDPAASHSAQ